MARPKFSRDLEMARLFLRNGSRPTLGDLVILSLPFQDFESLKDKVKVAKRAPSGLGKSGRKLWHSVLAEYDLSAHHLILLKEACLVCDEIARLQAFVNDAAGNESLHVQREVKAAVVELRLQRLLLSRLLSAMRFPED